MIPSDETFTIVPDDVLFDRKLSRDARVVYVCLLRHQTVDGYCDKSLDELSAYSQIPRSTLLRAITELRRAGLVVSIRRGQGQASLNYLAHRDGKRIALPSTARSKSAITAELRWEIWERDNFTCQVCGVQRDLTIDHITPRKMGGTWDKVNLRTLCRSCNARKGAR